MFKSIIAFGQNFAENFGLVFQNAAAYAVEKLNGLVDSANSVLGTSFKKLVPIAKAGFSGAITGPLDAASVRVKAGTERIA